MRHLDFSAKNSIQSKQKSSQNYLKETNINAAATKRKPDTIITYYKKIGTINLFGSICCIIGINLRKNKMIGQFLV